LLQTLIINNMYLPNTEARTPT